MVKQIIGIIKTPLTKKDKILINKEIMILLSVCWIVCMLILIVAKIFG